MKQRIQNAVQFLQRFAGRWWYTPLIGALAFADLFLIVIPTDGLLVSNVMLRPRRWIFAAFVVSLGSSLGSVALAYVLQTHGISFLLWISPGIRETGMWTWTQHLMTDWGVWAVFIVAVSPLMQHPAIALAAFANMRLWEIFATVMAGRLLKYLFLAWLASHAPGVLSRLWGMKHELEEVGLKDNSSNSNRSGT